jgi:hypothetical protein
MARPKSNKEVTSVNFDIEVKKALELKCRKEGINLSTFVNAVIRKTVMSEYEYYRQMTKMYASEMHKYRTLMDTAIDKPKEYEG